MILHVKCEICVMSVSGFLFGGSLPVATFDSTGSTVPKRSSTVVESTNHSFDEGKADSKARSRGKSKKLKSVPCRYWNGNKGSCKFGNKCRFIHGNSCAVSSSTGNLKRCAVCFMRTIFTKARAKHARSKLVIATRMVKTYYTVLPCVSAWASHEMNKGCPIRLLK